MSKRNQARPITKLRVSLLPTLEVQFRAIINSPWGPIDYVERWPEEKGNYSKAKQAAFLKRAEIKLIAFLELKLSTLKKLRIK